MEWYFLAIISLFLFGVNNFLYKVSAAKKCNSALTSLYQMIILLILSFTSFLILDSSVNSLELILFFGIIYSITFFGAAVSRMEAFKSIEASIGFPLIRLSTVIAIIFSIIFFKEVLSLYQWAGVVIAFIAIIILTSEGEKIDKKYKIGLTLILVSMLCSATYTILGKFVALYVNKLGYMTIAYAFGSMFAMDSINKLGKDTNNNHKTSLFIGGLIALANFTGYFLVLTALQTGPLSVISVIYGMSFVVAAVLSMLIYREKVTIKKTVGIILTIIAVILLGIGI